MKAILKTKPLLAAVTALNKVTPSKTFNPILENIFLEASPGTLRLVATDMETTLVVFIPENDATGCAVGEGGSACVPARFILDILKQVDAETIVFEAADDKTVTLDWTSGRSQLPAVPAEDFPAIDLVIEDGTDITLRCETLAKALSGTAYACSEDEIRPAMTGVLFDLSRDGFALVASDSHRLVIQEVPDVQANGKTQFILPRKQAGLVRGLCTEGENVTVRMSATNALFKTEDMTLAVRGCTGRFPKYLDVIPKNNMNILTTDRKNLISIIRRVAVCASRASQQIQVDFTTEVVGATMKVSGKDLGYGVTASEETEVEYVGDNLSIGFKAPFLTEILSNIEGDNVNISFSDNRRAVLIEPVEKQEDVKTTAILMPIMIS